MALYVKCLQTGQFGQPAQLFLREMIETSFLWGHSHITFTLKGGGGCPKEDLVRRVAWIWSCKLIQFVDKGGGSPKSKICGRHVWTLAYRYWMLLLFPLGPFTNDVGNEGGADKTRGQWPYRTCVEPISMQWIEMRFADELLFNIL